MKVSPLRNVRPPVCVPKKPQSMRDVMRDHQKRGTFSRRKKGR